MGVTATVIKQGGATLNYSRYASKPEIDTYNRQFSLEGNLMKDRFLLDENLDYQFLEITKSTPFLDLKEADGFFGLGANSQIYDTNSTVFIDQLLSYGLINKKVFSIYVGNE
jgi:hypothetical protein